MEITEKAYAKLNLSLDVTGKRPDGYHDLVMVMASVELCDDVTVSLRRDGAVTAESSLPWLPRDERNLGVKAARAYFAALGEDGLGAEIRMVKRIPVGAGMAGGSTDAAAVLLAVNELFGLGLPAEDLMARGKKLGADVPYCIMGGTALAEGIGEVLTPLPPAPGGFLLLAKPSFGVSTVWAYGRYDETAEKLEIAHPDIDGIVDAIAAGDRERMCGRMGNVLEPVAEEAHPQIGEIRACMKAHGAAGAMMSGSGPSVFGIFADEQAARASMKELRGSCRELYITGFFHGRNA